MSNLGYFQLKANPGVWKIELAQGRSKSIYQIDGPTGTLRNTCELTYHV